MSRPFWFNYTEKIFQRQEKSTADWSLTRRRRNPFSRGEGGPKGRMWNAGDTVGCGTMIRLFPNVTHFLRLIQLNYRSISARIPHQSAARTSLADSFSPGEAIAACGCCRPNGATNSHFKQHDKLEFTVPGHGESRPGWGGLGEDGVLQLPELRMPARFCLPDEASPHPLHYNNPKACCFLAYFFVVWKISRFKAKQGSPMAAQHF